MSGEPRIEGVSGRIPRDWRACGRGAIAALALAMAWPLVGDHSHAAGSPVDRDARTLTPSSEVRELPVRYPFTLPRGALELPRRMGGAEPARAQRGGLDFSLVGTLPGFWNWNCAFGDADHDGRREICAVVYDNASQWYHTRFIEHQGGNVYTTEAEVPYYYPFAMGDFDGDGLSDVLAQAGAFLQIFESSSPGGFPDHLAWQSPALTNVIGYPTIGDSDGDGRTEIIHSINYFVGQAELIIFEHTGVNDQYVQRYRVNTPSSVGREKQVADVDQDGRGEILIGADDGKVHVYEATGASWSPVAAIGVLGVAVTGVEAGADADHDGRREIYASGSSVSGWVTRVFEADGDNSYVFDGQAVLTDNYFGTSYNELRDFDGDGELELLMSGGVIYLFERTLGWNYAGQIDDPDGGVHSAVFADDLNGNGRAEVIWHVESSVESSVKTLVFESEATVAVGDPVRDPMPLAVWPNPVRGGASIRMQGMSAGADRPDRLDWVTLETIDPIGRLVAHSRVRADFREMRWNGADLSAGVYLVRVRGAGGAILGSARVSVVR